MAMNPMKRKARNSFLLGLLVAIIIAAIIVGLLFMKIKQLNEHISSIQIEHKIAVTQVYALTEDAKKNQTLAGNEDGEDAIIAPISMPTNLLPENALTNQKLDEFRDEDGALAIVAQFDMSKGTILTSDMVVNSEKNETYRLIEYRDISLPSKLETGNYIDIRLKDYTGANFIVLSKIKVEEATANTIWLKVSETQMMILNNAILESYMIKGSLLYATQYTNSAQRELATTYVPNEVVVQLMNANAFTDEEKELIKQAEEDFESKDKNGVENGIRRYIDRLLETYRPEEKADAASEGFMTEKTTTQAAREELLGEIGY